MPLIEHDSKHLRRSSKGDDDFRLSAAPRPQKQKNGGLFGQRSTQSLKHLSTTTADQGKPWSFVCAQSSMIADTIEGILLLCKGSNAQKSRKPANK
jgi:hypothetical protein